MHPLADPIASAVQQTLPPTATDTTTRTTTTPTITTISTIAVIADSTMGTRLQIQSFSTRNKKMILNWWIRARRRPGPRRVSDRRRGITRINSSSSMRGELNSPVIRVEGVLITNLGVEEVDVEVVVVEEDVEEEVGTGITGGIGLIVRLRLLSSRIGPWSWIWI